MQILILVLFSAPETLNPKLLKKPKPETIDPRRAELDPPNVGPFSPLLSVVKGVLIQWLLYLVVPIVGTVTVAGNDRS